MGVSSCLALKTLPCVRSKRSHVYFQNARVTKDTGVLNVHTRAFSTYTRERLSLFFSRLSPLVSPSLFFWCLSPLVSSSLFFSCLSLSFSSLQVTMTMITRPVGSLCTHSSDLPQGPECKGRGPFPVGLTCSHHARNNCLGVSCANLVPLGMKWACICAGNGCCVWWRLVVLVCVSMWWYVVVCGGMCCFAGCVSVGVDALAVVSW